MCLRARATPKTHKLLKLTVLNIKLTFSGLHLSPEMPNSQWKEQFAIVITVQTRRTISKGDVIQNG